MIIGYCVESNILLTTKVIKKKEGVLIDKIVGAFNTGFIMTLTAITAVTIALVMTQSSVIKEIMAILLIGLFADLIFTWIQNVALLRIYIDKQRGRHEL
jgi:preprotein translocase subunit SecF